MFVEVFLSGHLSDNQHQKEGRGNETAIGASASGLTSPRVQLRKQLAHLPLTEQLDAVRPSAPSPDPVQQRALEPTPTETTEGVVQFDLDRSREPMRNRRVRVAGEDENYQEGRSDPDIVEHGEDNAMEFSDEEMGWIVEVFSHSVIQMLYFAYGDCPQVVLHRLQQIHGPRSVRGEARRDAPRIALDDESRRVSAASRRVGVRTDELSFKHTLIHELIHFFVRRVRASGGNTGRVIPSQVRDWLKHPEQCGIGTFPPYAFGWFHVGGDVYVHLANTGDLETIRQADPAVYERVQAARTGGFERAPSGRAMHNPDEDIAETLALYINDQATRSTLQSNCPQRFQLMNAYYGEVVSYAQNPV